MMIINLNLLPPDQKMRVSRLVQILFAKNLLQIIIIPLCVFAMILLWSWLLLITRFNNLSESAMLISRDFTSYNQEVRKINSTIHAVNASAGANFAIFPKFVEIVTNTPNNVRLNSINIDYPNRNFIISGTARTRNDLLTFQENLKNIVWLQPANMPTTQLLQKDNLNFEFQTKIK